MTSRLSHVLVTSFACILPACGGALSPASTEDAAPPPSRPEAEDAASLDATIASEDDASHIWDAMPPDASDGSPADAPSNDATIQDTDTRIATQDAAADAETEDFDAGDICDGCTAPACCGVTTLASGQANGPISIAVDTVSVYWTNIGSGSVMSVPAGGGTPTTLASGQGYPGG